MTPKQKAKELVSKYYNFVYLELDYEQAKQCADIALDMVIQEGIENAVNDFYSEQGYYIDNLTYKTLGYNEYWQEVKNYIKLL
jgi:tRNA A37 N6-isopentenylltransferase MiaA